MAKKFKKVEPIKKDSDLKRVEDTLFDSFRQGRRNYTIFMLGKATLLRVSDVLSLKYNDVFNENGTLRKTIYMHDKKTTKQNKPYLKPVQTVLRDYHDYLVDNDINSEWLFPSAENSDKHIDRKQFYRIMQKVGRLLNLDYLGTHTMRKTGAYRVYEQTGHNIALVMDLLNHSSQSMTLKYLGLDETTKHNALDKIDFG